MTLAKLPMVQSVTCGENFSQRSQGYTFGFELLVTDLHAYQADQHHVHVRDTIISPLVQEGGYLSVDYEFPRGVEATPEMQRWDATHCNEDLQIEHNRISPKSDGTIWRTVVAARPTRDHGYAEFLIDRNPKPANRGIQIGVVTRAELPFIKEAGKNFINFKTGFAWQSNGGFVSGMEDLPELVIPHVPWEHDHTVGVLVDVDRSIVQFFYDRKKVGPAVHLKALGHEVFFALAIDVPHTTVQAQWNATPPKVFLA